MAQTQKKSHAEIQASLARIEAKGVRNTQAALKHMSEMAKRASVCPPDCPLRTLRRRPRDEALPDVEDLPEVDQKDIARHLYQPIRSWQTRLLIVERGELGSELSGRLVTVDLIFAAGAVIHETQEHVRFTAVSYTWGSPHFTRFIRLNGHLYSITNNLWALLQRHRETHQSLTIWVDAICINQHDLLEKAVQVANMLTIYRKAQHVVVSLGEHGRYTSLAMDYLAGYRYTRDSDVRQHDEVCQPVVPYLLEGLDDLCRRPWLRRIWVKREVWIAGLATAYCGTSSLLFSAFRQNLEDISNDLATNEHNSRSFWIESSVPRNVAVPAICSLRQTQFRPDPLQPAEDHARRSYIGCDSDDIVTLLNESTRCESTDVRDRIYALLGMSTVAHRARDPLNAPDQPNNNQTAPVLFVDYTRPVKTVFEDLARYILERETVVSSVLALDAKFGHCGGLELPSWLPDWRYGAFNTPYLRLERQIQKLCAHDSLPGMKWACKAPALVEPGVLGLSGFYAGSLVSDLSFTRDEWVACAARHSQLASADVSAHDLRAWAAVHKVLIQQSQEEVLRLKERLESHGWAELYQLEDERLIVTGKDVDIRRRERQIATLRMDESFSTVKHKTKYMGFHGLPLTPLPRESVNTSHVFSDLRTSDEIRRDNQGQRVEQHVTHSRRLDVETEPTCNTDTESETSGCSEPNLFHVPDVSSILDQPAYKVREEMKSMNVAGRRRDSYASSFMGINSRSSTSSNYQGKRFVAGADFCESTTLLAAVSELAVPDSAIVGDIVVVVEGCLLPLVLRPVSGSAATFTFIGLALLTDELYAYRGDTYLPEATMYERWLLEIRFRRQNGDLESFRVV